MTEGQTRCIFCLTERLGSEEHVVALARGGSLITYRVFADTGAAGDPPERQFAQPREADIAPLHHAVRLPVRTVGIDAGDRVLQRRARSVLLDQPDHVQPAVAVAARAGNIKVRDATATAPPEPPASAVRAGCVTSHPVRTVMAKDAGQGR
jgi:hypothetical protein